MSSASPTTLETPAESSPLRERDRELARAGIRRKLVVVGQLAPPITGEALAFESFVEYLDELGVEHVVVDTSGSLKHSHGNIQSWRRALDYCRIVPKVARHLSGFRRGSVLYQLLAQSRMGFARDFAMIWIAALLRRRIVAHLHGGDYAAFYEKQPKWLQYLIRRTLLRTDTLIVLSDRLSGMYDFEPRLRDRIKVVPNGLPVATTPMSSQRASFDGTRLRLLYLSNMLEAKGYLTVLDAVRILVQERRLDVECHFCGAFFSSQSGDTANPARTSEEIESQFTQLVQTYDLTKHVRYQGVVSGEAKQKELEEAHVLVLPSRKEGQPLAIIEGLANGLVIISTDVGAISDMVIDGETGYLVPFGDAESIARSVANIAGNPRGFAAMSAAGRRLFEAQFTKERYQSRLLRVVLGVDEEPGDG